MRRNFSYSVTIILSSLLLLIAIDATLWLTIQATNYIKSNLIGTLLIFAADLLLIGFALYIFGRMRPYLKGDVGEESIKFILAKLRDYYYLSDVMIGDKKGNIDTVVIGPTGIWTVEVKNQSERVIIHDKYLDGELRQSYAEAKAVENLLIQLGYVIPVVPVLVFANKRARMTFGLAPVNGVYVIGKTWLEKLLTKQSTGYLSPEKCFEIKEKLKPYTSKLN